MAIQFQCPYCSATIRVPDAAAGKIGDCPKCRAKLQVPEVEPPPPSAVGAAAIPAEDVVAPPTGGLLGDKSAVFVLPPASGAEPPIGPPPEIAPPLPPQPMAPAANPAQAREEYSEGKAWLSKPHVRGAGWPAADRAVRHFQRAAELDPQNGDYATQTGIASLRSIERFLESWGTGPLTSIAAFHLNEDLGRRIDKAESLFRPSGISPENHFLLIERANEGLRWFSRALELDPEDAVARCHRAQLLSQIGAFSAALDDAKAVLSSPLVPSQTRDAAQRVTDFVLGEDSPLRKFLTRSQAQHLPAPGGVQVPRPPAPKPKVTAASPVPADSIGPIVINTGSPSPIIAPPGSLDPTQAEMPLITAPSPQPSARPSVAARLRTRQKGNWQAAIIPIVLGLALLAIGLGYMYFNRVTFTGPITGQDLGNHTLHKTLFRNEFGIPDDRADDLLTAFREDPEVLRTKLRVLGISGTSAGLNVSLRPGEGARMVRVDLRADPSLANFCKQHADKLEAPLAPLRAEVLKKFATDFETARGSGMRLGNLGEYLDALGGNLLVQGLGYHVTGIAENVELPCVFEDQSGAVYFLVPNGTSQFEIVERKFDGTSSVFETAMRYEVSIVKSETPAPTNPPPTTDETLPQSDAAPDTPMSEDGRPGQTMDFGGSKQLLPPGFYGEDQ